ncbi:hypothetical protein ACHAWC_001193 [Mediolabrus comicus]
MSANPSNNLNPAQQQQLQTMAADIDWAITIQEKYPRFDPDPNRTEIPLPPITRPQVIYQLERILYESRWCIRNMHRTAFLHPVTRQIRLVNFATYRQQRFFITLVLQHLKNDHAGNGNSFAPAAKHISKRELYYKWKIMFKSYYSKKAAPRAFDRQFKMFLNIVNLPQCALRIVSEARGQFCMPAKIVRKALGSQDIVEDCMFRMRGIGEEFMCRLNRVMVPEYHDVSLEIEPYEDYEVKHSLVVEKNCVLRTMFGKEFHMEKDCFIMSGSGFPDTNSRACAKYFELYFKRQIQGFCDNNPSGVLLLNTYQYNKNRVVPHNMFNTDIGWFGFNPAFGECVPQPSQSKSYNFHDEQIIEYLLEPSNRFVATRGTTWANRQRSDYRKMQLQRMMEDDKKNDIEQYSRQALVWAIGGLFKDDHSYVKKF